MWAERTLQKKLQSLPLINVHGSWSRCVAYEHLIGPPPGAAATAPPDPLWPGGSKRHGQRFTPKGSFDSVYLAQTVDTALLEAQAVFRTSAGLSPTVSNPTTLVTVETVVFNILNTCHPEIQHELGTSTSELTGAWAHVPDGGRPPTQILGAAAYQSGKLHGIQYTSSKNPPALCLCVFVDRLDASHELLRVIDRSGNLVNSLP